MDSLQSTVKDIVFTCLFKESRYQLELFQALHPEKSQPQQGDIERITINYVLSHDTYNDVGLLMRDKLLVLIEA